MTMWFSSQHFHPLEIKAKRMNTLIVGVHFHFKWDVTTGYEEKHLVMVIQLCKIAAFHPVSSDMRLSQSFNYKIFSEGRRSQAAHCPFEGSCPGRSLWEQSQATQPNCLRLKPGASCFSRFKYGSDLLYAKGLLLSLERRARLTSLQNGGPQGGSKANQWQAQEGPGPQPGSLLPASLPLMLYLWHTRTTGLMQELLWVRMVALQTVTAPQQTIRSCSSKSHGYNFLQMLYPME